MTTTNKTAKEKNPLPTPPPPPMNLFKRHHKINKVSSGSMSLVIPKDFCNELGIAAGDTVEIRLDAEKGFIIITKA